MNSKRGSATILITMIAAAIILAVCASISVARRITLGSVVNSYGSIWTKAILSEYDVHLLEDYGILAYQGCDAEVAERLNEYIEYSIDGRLSSDINTPSVELSRYCMSDSDNFRKALEHSIPEEVLGSLIKGNKRKLRDKKDDSTNMVIKNSLVISTLPSGQVKDNPDIKGLAEELKNAEKPEESLLKPGADAVREVILTRKYLDNHLYAADEKDKFFDNEWEYVIAGKLDDDENFKVVKRRIFIIRNVLNLAALYKEPEIVEMVTAAAEVITPGPLGVVTQGVIMEAWAALESEEDVKSLLDNKRVPLIKKASEFKIGLDKVLRSDDVNDALDDEAKENLRDHMGEIAGFDAEGAVSEVTDGQNYEDYLMFMILAMNRNVRTLRIMDIIQIDMKLRYYRDWNFEEMYSGVAYDMHVNGRDRHYEYSYR